VKCHSLITHTHTTTTDTNVWLFGFNCVASAVFVCSQPGSDSGTTAVVGLIRGKQLIVANAGDSRCVVSERGKLCKLFVFSFWCYFCKIFVTNLKCTYLFLERPYLDYYHFCQCKGLFFCLFFPVINGMDETDMRCPQYNR